VEVRVTDVPHQNWHWCGPPENRRGVGPCPGSIKAVIGLRLVLDKQVSSGKQHISVYLTHVFRTAMGAARHPPDYPRDAPGCVALPASSP